MSTHTDRGRARLAASVVLVVGLVVLTGCTGQAPPAPVARGESLQVDPRGPRAPDQADPCARRAPDALALIAKTTSPADGPAWLCRYRHAGALDRGLRLQGGKPLAPSVAQRLYDAFVHRSRGMVDCAGDLREPLYAVIDRDPQGRPRIVTVDLALCATIAAEVAGAEEYGLATDRHRRLLEVAWRRS